MTSDKQKKPYQRLKRLLTSKTILCLPDMKKQFVLRTYASDVGIGAMLLPEVEGELFTVSFANRKLFSAERAYPAMIRECLAIVLGIKTDYKPLTFLNESKFSNSRIIR